MVSKSIQMLYVLTCVPDPVHFIHLGLVTLTTFVRSTNYTDFPYVFNFLKRLRKIAKSEFKVCKSVHHHTVQINQPTRCNT